LHKPQGFGTLNTSSSGLFHRLYSSTVDVLAHSTSDADLATC